MGFGSFIKKNVGKVAGVVNKVDPTGISSNLLTAGLATNAGKGGMIGGLARKAAGMSADGGGGSAPTKRARYERKKRNPWKSRRQKAFEGTQTKAQPKSRRFGRLRSKGKYDVNKGGTGESKGAMLGAGVKNLAKKVVKYS